MSAPASQITMDAIAIEHEAQLFYDALYLTLQFNDKEFLMQYFDRFSSAELQRVVDAKLLIQVVEDMNRTVLFDTAIISFLSKFEESFILSNIEQLHRILSDNKKSLEFLQQIEKGISEAVPCNIFVPPEPEKEDIAVSPSRLRPPQIYVSPVKVEDHVVSEPLTVSTEDVLKRFGFSEEPKPAPIAAEPKQLSRKSTSKRNPPSPTRVDNGFFGLEPYDVHYKIGNCLFEAVAAHVERSTGADMRKAAVELIASNTDEGEELQSKIRAAIGDRTDGDLLVTEGEELHAVQFNSVEGYLDFMSRDQVWAGEIELCALSKILQRPIVVLTTDRRFSRIYDVPEAQMSDPIFLNYIDDDHYKPMVAPPGIPSWAILQEIRDFMDEVPVVRVSLGAAGYR